MKLAIMQPYLFPYIGYFQLINAVDNFIVYDDVNYIKQGWVNRNRILLNDSPYLFTLHLKNSSSFKLINQIEIGNNKIKLLKTFEQTYLRAPFYEQVSVLLKQIFEIDETNLAKFVYQSINIICTYLGIKTKIIISSGIIKNNLLKGETKVISICKALNADIYINAIGGTELYSKELFLEDSINLYFLKTNEIIYKQFNNIFIPNLSIIDVLMFNPPEQIMSFINQYELI